MEKFKITLIKAEDADKEFLFDLRKQTMVKHLEKSGIFLSDIEHKSRVNIAYDGAYIVLKSSQKVGVLKIIETKNAIEILQLQVAPEYQGMGIGKQVVEQVINKAQTNNKITKLKVLKENPARLLYERCGFIITGEDQHQFCMQITPV